MDVQEMGNDEDWEGSVTESKNCGIEKERKRRKQRRRQMRKLGKNESKS